jgi:hypothetical protein
MYKCIVCIYSMSDHNTIEIVFLLCIFRKLLFGKRNTLEGNRALEAKTHEQISEVEEKPFPSSLNTRNLRREF